MRPEDSIDNIIKIAADNAQLTDSLSAVIEALTRSLMMQTDADIKKMRAELYERQAALSIAVANCPIDQVVQIDQTEPEPQQLSPFRAKRQFNP
jgi:hypothetical protein